MPTDALLMRASRMVRESSLRLHTLHALVPSHKLLLVSYAVLAGPHMVSDDSGQVQGTTGPLVTDHGTFRPMHVSSDIMFARGKLSISRRPTTELGGMGCPAVHRTPSTVLAVAAVALAFAVVARKMLIFKLLVSLTKGNPSLARRPVLVSTLRDGKKMLQVSEGLKSMLVVLNKARMTLKMHSETRCKPFVEEGQ